MGLQKALVWILGLNSKQRKIEWLVRHLRGRRILDLGFVGEQIVTDGDRNWVHGRVAEVASKCVGLDHNEREVAIFRERGFNVIVGDAQDFETDDRFDVVVACDVIEHLEDPKGFLTCVARALEPEGKLLLTTPNPWFFRRFIRCLVKGDGGVNPDHVCWFCRETIQELLRRHGFSTEAIEFGSGQPVFYRLFFLPEVLRHTSINVVARKCSTVSV